MGLNGIRVLSALQLLGDAFDSKRIALLQLQGFEVEVVAFEREIFKSRLPDCPIERLGKISNRHYLQRVFVVLIALPALRRAIRRNHVVYAHGPDIALYARLAGLGLGRPVVLNIKDIRRLQISKGVLGRVLRLADRYIANACALIVATAPGFIEEYYRKWVKTRTPAMILENKQEPTDPGMNGYELSAKMKKKALVDRPLRIGYFGVLRCEWSWRVMEALALERPDDVEIVVAGYIQDFLHSLNIPGRIEELANVTYLGEFRSPDDLPSLYSDIDILWGCYPYPDSDDHNWRWARTNRFYESCFYQKPIIALRDSGDALVVEQHDIGPIVHGPDIGTAVEALSKITRDDLTRWQENISKLPRDVYVYTHEGEELATLLTELVEKSNVNP